MNDGDERFAYLLQPIKDLQKNWDMDLEGMLEKYMDELNAIADEAEVGVDKKKVDFAEASRVIQGTSAIYGKKVDFVFDDVITFKNLLLNQKGKKGKKGSNDGVEEDDGIDPVETEPTDNYALIDYTKSKRSNIEALCLKSGPKRVLTVPLMPMSLMPLADYEKCNVPMYARKNSKEVIGKKDDFKMNTAYISTEGAVLLDLINHSLITKFSSIDTTSNSQSIPSQPSRCQSYMNPTDQFPSSTQPSTQPFPSQSDFTYDDYHDTDDEIVAAMGDKRPSSFIHPVEAIREGALSSIEERRRTEEVLRQSQRYNLPPIDESYGEGGYDPYHNDGFSDREDMEIDNVSNPVMKNPWEEDEYELDPIESIAEDEFIEYKWKRCPYQLSQCEMKIKTIQKRKIKEYNEMDERGRAIETITYINQYIQRKGTKKILNTKDGWTKNALSRFTNTVSKKKIKKETKKGVPRRSAKIFIPNEDKENVEREDEVYVNEDDDYGDVYDDDGYDRNDYGYNDRMDVMDNDVINMGDTLMAEENTQSKYDDKLELREEDHMFTKGVLVYITGGDRDGVVNSVIDNHWNDKNDILVSEMSKRVSAWSETLHPILAEEEKFKDFDIHEYGDEMLKKFESLNELKCLPQLLMNCDEREVSRYMLSILMMANTYNVHIDYDDTSSQVVPMNVTLLKRERHHEQIDKEGVL